MESVKASVVDALRAKYQVPVNPPHGFWRKPEGQAILKEIQDLDWETLTQVTGRSKSGLEKIFAKAGIKRVRPLYAHYDAEDIVLVEKFASVLNQAKPSEVSALWRDYLARMDQRRESRGLPVVTQNAIRCWVRDLNLRRSVEGKPPLLLRSIQKNEKSDKLAEGVERRAPRSYPSERIEALLGVPDLPSQIELQKDPPRTTAAQPFRLAVKDERHAKIFLVNAPAIGTIADVDDNRRFILRNALRLGKALQVDAVLMTGNLIYVDWLRYSNLRPFRSRLSGIQAKDGITHHPPAVETESGKVSTRVKEGRVAFVTFKQRFDYVLSLVREQTLENGKPVFDGPIYISFGSIEEALAMWYANEKIALDVAMERKVAGDYIRALKSRIVRAEKAMRQGEAPDIEIEAAQEELKDWIVYRDLFVKMTNVIDSFTNIVSSAMRNYMIQQIENAIHGAKVVSVGDTYFEIPHAIRGPWLAQVAYEKTTDSITGEFGGRLREAMRERSKRDPRPPDIVFGGGLNPKLEYLHVPYRTRGEVSEYEDMRVARILQLPTLLHSSEFRDVASTFVQAKDRLTKLAMRGEFMAGLVYIEIIDGFGRVSAYDDQYLTNPDIFGGESQAAEARITESVKNPELIYCELEGDNHRGARFSAFYEDRRAKDGRLILYHDQLVFKFLLEQNAPVVSFSNTGDTLHWQNYPTSAEQHPKYLPEDQLVLEIRKIQSDASLTGDEKNRRINILVQKNAIFAGLLSPEEQLDAYLRSLKPEGLKFLSQVIERANAIGFKTYGEIGIITYVHGNHNEHSFPKEKGVLITESNLIRNLLVRDLAIYRPDLFGKLGKKYLDPMIESKLERTVKAPRYGTLGVGVGLFGIIDDPEGEKMSRDQAREQSTHYLYGAYIRHKQATSKKKSNVRAMQRAFADRGSIEADFAGRFVVNQAGDDHYGGFILEHNTLHIKNAGQTFRSEFGERRDFPLANIMTMVWAVPKKGPQTGPITVVPLCYEDLRPWIRYRYPVNGEALFAGAARPLKKALEKPSSTT